MMYPGIDSLAQLANLVQQQLAAAAGSVHFWVLDRTTTPDLVKILENFNDSLPALEQLLVGIAYLSGIFLVFKAVYLMKQYGELRTMMSLQTDLRGPIMMIIIGSILLYLPTSYKFAIGTFYGMDSIMQVPIDNDDRWKLISGLVQHMIQVVGLFAFIRGWLLMAKVVDKNNQTATFSKAMTHIVGGVMALNIAGTRAVINATFGVNL